MECYLSRFVADPFLEREEFKKIASSLLSNEKAHHEHQISFSGVLEPKEKLDKIRSSEAKGKPLKSTLFFTRIAP